MKNILLTFLLTLCICNTVTAQFQAGESFISGSFFNNFNHVKQKDEAPDFNSYNHYINLSAGKFVRDNRALGWGLTHRLIKESNNFATPKPAHLRELGFGIERFAEYYKPIGEKFALYGRPAFSLGYTFQNSNYITQEQLVFETKKNTISISAGISAGIVWRVSPRWALYGSFAFLNPIDLGFSFSKTDFFQQLYPNGDHKQTTGKGFTYNFSPSLSSGSIGLGFRYFYGAK